MSRNWAYKLEMQAVCKITLAVGQCYGDTWGCAWGVEGWGEGVRGLQPAWPKCGEKLYPNITCILGKSGVWLSPSPAVPIMKIRDPWPCAHIESFAMRQFLLCHWVSVVQNPPVPFQTKYWPCSWVKNITCIVVVPTVSSCEPCASACPSPLMCSCCSGLIGQTSSQKCWSRLT